MEFKSICEQVQLGHDHHKVSYLMLNCCKPKSKAVKGFQKLVVSLTEDSPCYELSLQASVLLGLLEKDFRHVISCPIQTLLSHIEDTGIDLPRETQPLYSILSELHDIGFLFTITSSEQDNMQIVLNISQLTNNVHQLLFSNDAADMFKDSFNIGIIPQHTLEELLPKYITKECLVQLQYCQEIYCRDIDVFPSLPFSHSTDQSFLFFPALCTAERNEDSWNRPPSVRYG